MLFRLKTGKQFIASIAFAIIISAKAGTINVPSDFKTIQAALFAAIDGDEVVVAPGTYIETINFNGKAITLRSSDGPEVTTIDGTGNFHVVRCVSSEDLNTVLDGFTITGGNARGMFGNDHDGGGMYIDSGSPTVINCIFIGNTAHDSGGGIYNYNGSPTLTNCMFIGNTAHDGGGLVNDAGSIPMINNCTFSGNTAQFGGGAIRNSNSSPTISNCTFIANSADDYAGGFYNVEESNPTLTDCMFSENNSSLGGAMYNFDSSSTVTNCTYDANYAIAGGAIFNYNSSPTIDKCTFSRNSAIGGGGMFNGNSSSPPISESVFCDNDPDHIAGPWTDEGGNQFLDECCPADLNGDGSVGTADLLELFAQWGTAGPADFDGSGAVGKNDLLILFANWGPCP